MRPDQLAFLQRFSTAVTYREVPDWLIAYDHADQAAFIADERKSLAVLGTRRSGKTHGAASRLYRAARKHKRSIALYMALTRDSAKRIIWPILQEMNEKESIGAKFSEHNLTATLPNGSTIVCVGADMKNFIGRLKGAKYSEACIDEAQLFRSHLDDLINDVLKPALIDYDGALVLCGTPGPIKEGTFYRITTQNEGRYSQHRLSIFSNPFIPRAREWIEEHKKDMGWDETNATLRREYYGEWVEDESALVYQFNREKNMKPWPGQMAGITYIMGLDFGYNDKTACSVIAYSKTDRRSWIVFSDGHSDMTVTEIAEWVKSLYARYKPDLITADTGGLGKTIAAELIVRHSLPIRAAEKIDKLAWIALMNDEFRRENLLLDVSCTKLADQYRTLTKSEKGKEDPRLSNDLADSALYGFRYVYSYLAQKPTEAPEYGSRKWADDQARRMEEEAIRAARERAEQERELDPFAEGFGY
jgi:hypothetical protein